MTWKEQLRPASFRGVPFHVDGNSTTGGRRVARHDLPNGEVPFYEDLGIRAREFQIRGYLLGADFIAQRNALLAACEQEGAGILVHPTYGTLSVRCTSFFSQESQRAGGRADVLMIFSLEERAPSAATETDPLEEAEQAADELAGAAEADLEETLEVEGHPEFVREATSAELSETGTRFLDLQVFSRKAQEVAAFATKAQRLIDDAASLATSPVDLIAAVRGAVEGIRSSAENGLAALHAYRTLFGVSPTLHGGTSPSQKAADQNTLAVSNQVRYQVLAEATAAVIEIEWESYDQAVWARDILLTEIDALGDQAGDSVFRSLGRLHRALVNALPPEEVDLPRLETIQLTGSTGALQLAYELYEDTDRAQEIVDRNSVRHPAFVPAGEPLQVLVHG